LRSAPPRAACQHTRYSSDFAAISSAGHVGEHELDRLERHDRPSELLALGRERQREIQRPRRRADGARADHEPLLDEPVLRELVATADPAEDPVLADPDALEREDRVLEHERMHVLRRANEPDARRVLVDEEHRRLRGVAVDVRRVTRRSPRRRRT
jgi:hypothetical protein